ncbi:MULTISPECIES: glycosyltransferase [Haloferax]|nr:MULTISPECIES: glycosyltransferase [Haloferax]
MDVIVSGPNHHGYVKSISNGFRRCGANIILHQWPEIYSKNLTKYLSYLKSKISGFDSLGERHEYQLQQHRFEVGKYNEELLNLIEESLPDILLIIRGDLVQPSTVQKIQEETDTVIVTWIYDDLSHCPNATEIGALSDLFYLFDATDVEYLNSRGISCKFLPMAFDDENYSAKDYSKRDTDIVFVGKLYKNRIKILNKVINSFPNKNVEIWGSNWNWSNPKSVVEFKIKRRKIDKSLNNYNIGQKRVSELYNSSSICLNIHRPDASKAVNPRTFEILGAGGFQLVDQNSQITNLFENNKDLVCYYSSDDLIEKIRYYLKNPNERHSIAQQGHITARRDHTFKSRAKEILDDVLELA